MSKTRWSDRIDSVSPFAAHIPGLQSALTELLQLNLTSETKAEVKGLYSYINSFPCVICHPFGLKYWQQLI